MTAGAKPNRENYKLRGYLLWTSPYPKWLKNRQDLGAGPRPGSLTKER